MTISNEQLREAFLPPAMLCYFEQKLPDVAPSEVLVRVEETLKFLNMATHLSGDIPVTPEIDDVWHLWILETQAYADLCDRLHGRRFIHHMSNVYARCAAQPAPHDEDAWLGQQVAALAAYVANYGDFAPDRVRYWRLAASLTTERGMSLDRLNAWLKTGRAEAGPAGSAPPQPTPTTT